MVFCMCVCAQSRLTLCNPMDCNPPGSSVHEILQARILERVAISYSRGYSQSRDQTRVSCVSCIGNVFLPFHTVHGVLSAKTRKRLAIPPRVDRILSELFTMTHPSWVALHGMAHSSNSMSGRLIASNLSKSIPQSLMLKKLKLTSSMKTYKTYRTNTTKKFLNVLFITGDLNAKVRSRK